LRQPDGEIQALLTQLRSGAPHCAWTAFLTSCSGLIYGVVHIFAHEQDHIADCFVFACEKLAEKNYRRILSFRPDGKARFTTWLRAVVSFGTSGQANLTSLSLLYSVALQTINSQQYIVAAGGSASTGAFSLARLSPVGALDTTFGSSAGYSTTDFCGAGSTIFSVNVETSGNILAGGTAALVANGSPKFGIARFDHNGLLDATFGDPSSSGLTRTGRTLLDFYGYKNFLMSLLPVLDANGNQVSYLAAGYAGQSTGQF
jgi:hypothetical protein